MRHPLLAMLVLLTPLPAAADAIPEQPPCPTGSTRNVQSHEVIYCEATTCDSDEACAQGTCQTLGLCVEAITRHVSNTFPAEPGDPGREASWRDARATCAAGDTCLRGTCEVARRCGSAPTPATPARTPATEPAAAQTSETDEAQAPASSTESSDQSDQSDESDGGGCAVGARAAGGDSTLPGWLLAALALSGWLRRSGARARATPSAR